MKFDKLRRESGLNRAALAWYGPLRTTVVRAPIKDDGMNASENGAMEAAASTAVKASV